MSVLRIRALDLLAECIGREVPELDGRICAGPAEVGHKLKFPHLVINPIRYVYQPEQAREWRSPTFDTVIMEVGKHEADVQIRIGAGTHRQRVILEDKVLQVFLSQPLAPGVLVQQVVDCHDAVVAWELQGEAWEDELAFDQKWYSTIEITGQIPALVCRRDAYTIEQLQSGLTEEFGILFDETTMNTSAAVEVVEINQDGSISPV